MPIRNLGRSRARVAGLLLLGLVAAFHVDAASAAGPTRPTRRSAPQSHFGQASPRQSSPKQSARHDEPTPGLLDAFLSSSETAGPTRVTFLGRRRDRAAARQLLELARDPETRASGRAAHALVVALDAHARGPERDAIVRELLGLYRIDAGPVRDERGPVHVRVRGAAALALARSDHPVALRELWSDAEWPNETDPLSLALAREALRAHPISTERARVLGLSTARSDALRSARERDTKAEEERCSPLRLAKLDDDAARAACQMELLERSPLPAAWLDASAWKEALAGPSRLHALRTLTLLASEHDELRRLTLESAERELKSDAPRLRASARFALAVLSPARAVADWARLDAVERAALLRQARSPEIGDFLREELRARPLPPGPLAIAAERVVFGFPAGFERPARLRRVEKRGPRLLALAELAYWLRPDDAVTTGPSVLEVRGWLGSNVPLERAATAFGLGQSPAPRATGLLIRAYENEADPAVRRALVHALVRRRSSPDLDRWLSVVAALEPDRVARERAREAIDWPQSPRPSAWADSDTFDATSSGTRSFTFQYLADGPVAARGIIHVATDEGRVIPVIPEPDGYYALSGDAFATPSR